MLRWLVVVPGTLALTVQPAVGQQDDAGVRAVPIHEDTASPSADAATITAAWTTASMQLDGRLGEAAWATADSIADFRQREPREGAPASERTVVRVVRDGDALYVAVRAYDATPSGIRAVQLRRDSWMSSDDNVTILIDSFHDRRSGFLFRTNPNGAMWDAQSSGGDDSNEDWNGIWSVATSRDSAGWTAEFRIPFRTLRFRAGGSPTFGFNVRRFIRRKNEEDLWRSYGRSQGLDQLQNAGTITGLQGLERQRHVELLPYVLVQGVASEHDISGAATTEGGFDVKTGLDAKLAVSPTLTADFTVNTDFAQVEVDRQVVNLTRFPTFFPEKREFFLESSSIFEFGAHRNAQLFYSRRIGLRDGEPVRILGGARLYGKVGPWTLGVLDTRTGDGDDANAAVIRVKRDIFERSYVGAMVTQRSGPGVDGVERAGGFDIDLPLVVNDRNIQPSFWIAGTQLPGVRGTPVAWRARVDYPNDFLDAALSIEGVERGFSPTLGFVSRTGILQASGHLTISPRPDVLGIRQFRFMLPIPRWEIVANQGGSLTRVSDWQSAEFEWQPLGMEFQSGDRLEVSVQRNMDRLTEAFDIFGGVVLDAGRYWWTRGEVEYETSEGRPLSGRASVSWGGFYDGSNTEIDLSADWSGVGNFILGADLSRNIVRFPSGRFATLETSGRVEYDFSTRMSLQSFVQYNNGDQRIDFNVRFHWIPVIGDDVYVVWNSGYTTDPIARYRFPDGHSLSRPLNGALVIKAVHRFTP